MATAAELKEKCVDLNSTIDYIVEEMKKQGCQSKDLNDGEETCLYRGEIDGKEVACGIGKIIPDFLYRKSLETYILWKILKYDELIVGEEFKKAAAKLRKWWQKNMPWVLEYEYFFKDLQKAHDNFRDWITTEEGLNFPEYFEQAVNLLKQKYEIN